MILLCLSQLKDGLQDHDEINFSECLPLLEYTKEVMLKRYGLKRLADKFYRVSSFGLRFCCVGVLPVSIDVHLQLCLVPPSCACLRSFVP